MATSGVSEEKAIKIQKEFEAIAGRYGLFMTVEHEKKPNLKMIRIKEITIKVTE